MVEMGYAHQIGRNAVSAKLVAESEHLIYIQGDFFQWYPPKKLEYGKPRLGESTLT